MITEKTKGKIIKDIIRLGELIQDEMIINELIAATRNLGTLRALYSLKYFLSDVRKTYLL